jgi:hypothetical protein
MSIKMILISFFVFLSHVIYGSEFYVAKNGNDANPGTKDKPFATFSKAKQTVRALIKTTNDPIIVYVREGTYYLRNPLIFGPEDSGTSEAPISYIAYENELVTISGGINLQCDWKSYKNGIMMCNIPEVKNGSIEFSQLFANGKRQHLARFPNYDNSVPGQTGYILPKGTIPPGAKDPSPGRNIDMTFNNPQQRGIIYNKDTFSQNSWAKPPEAVIHIYQAPHWGNLQWTVKEIDYENQYIWFGIGGHQIGAKWTQGPIRVNQSSQFFIENVFEELDTPGEWYLDKEKGILYYIPEKNLNLNNVLIEVPLLQQLIQFRGSQYNPVQNISFEGFRVTHTTSTFMEQYWVPSGSDWSIHRGGTLFFEGTRDCAIKECWFDAVGGNAVFMNNYNRNNTVSGCKFTEAGESAICFVGTLEFTNGTHLAFPYECQATNNLIHDCGVFGKQVAGVYISRAKRIVAAHNLIYNMPRAGICIGDGTWGGHVVEFNHVYNCIRETWDHGPFNSWGREGYWCLTHAHGEDEYKYPHPAGRVKVWAMEPTIIRNNYWHGNVGYDGGYRQGIDMDDGTSNYHIYNNVCKDMAISIREGAYRTVENNIIINPVVPFGVHVGHPENHDIIRRNILVTDGSVYYMNQTPHEHPILEEINFNVFYHPSPSWGERTTITRSPRSEEIEKYTLAQWQEMGYDTNSVVADPMFVDLENENYRLKPESPALKLGFKQLDMSWGLTDEFPEKWRK